MTHAHHSGIQHHPDVQGLASVPLDIEVHNHFDHPIDIYHVYAGVDRELLYEGVSQEILSFTALNSDQYIIVDPNSGKELDFFYAYEDDAEPGEPPIYVIGPENAVSQENTVIASKIIVSK